MKCGALAIDWLVPFAIYENRRSMKMDFWDESWSAIDKSRLREYITRKEEPDEMIEYLLC